jgi:hypothetical protein
MFALSHAPQGIIAKRNEQSEHVPLAERPNDGRADQQPVSRSERKSPFSLTGKDPVDYQ